MRVLVLFGTTAVLMTEVLGAFGRLRALSLAVSWVIVCGQCSACGGLSPAPRSHI